MLCAARPAIADTPAPPPQQYSSAELVELIARDLVERSPEEEEIRGRVLAFLESSGVRDGSQSADRYFQHSLLDDQERGRLSESQRTQFLLRSCSTHRLLAIAWEELQWEHATNGRRPEAVQMLEAVGAALAAPDLTHDSAYRLVQLLVFAAGPRDPAVRVYDLDADEVEEQQRPPQSVPPDHFALDAARVVVGLLARHESEGRSLVLFHGFPPDTPSICNMDERHASVLYSQLMHLVSRQDELARAHVELMTRIALDPATDEPAAGMLLMVVREVVFPTIPPAWMPIERRQDIARHRGMDREVSQRIAPIVAAYFGPGEWATGANSRRELQAAHLIALEDERARTLLARSFGSLSPDDQRSVVRRVWTLHPPDAALVVPLVTELLNQAGHPSDVARHGELAIEIAERVRIMDVAPRIAVFLHSNDYRLFNAALSYFVSVRPPESALAFRVAISHADLGRKLAIIRALDHVDFEPVLRELSSDASQPDLIRLEAESRAADLHRTARVAVMTSSAP